MDEQAGRRKGFFTCQNLNEYAIEGCEDIEFLKEEKTRTYVSNHALQMYQKASTKNLYLIGKGDRDSSNNYFNN
jgi:hypothetical protein